MSSCHIHVAWKRSLRHGPVVSWCESWAGGIGYLGNQFMVGLSSCLWDNEGLWYLRLAVFNAFFCWDCMSMRRVSHATLAIHAAEWTYLSGVPFVCIGSYCTQKNRKISTIIFWELPLLMLKPALFISFFGEKKRPMAELDCPMNPNHVCSTNPRLPWLD